MGSVKEYFSSLGTGVVSLLKGLAVTGKEFVTPKITEYYPEDRTVRKWPERFRAILELIYDKEGNHRCIACGTCERVCPNGTITLETKMVETADGKKKKKLDKYIYDLGSCTFCQLCVTNCPTNALAFSNDFEQAVFTRDKLVKKLNYLPEKEEPAPAPKPAEEKQAAAAPAAEVPAEYADVDPKIVTAAKAAYKRTLDKLTGEGTDAAEAEKAAKAAEDKIISLWRAKNAKSSEPHAQ